MNVVQALAVAAAAFVVWGEPAGAGPAEAEARLASLAARGEAIAEQVFARTTANAVGRARCSKLASKLEYAEVRQPARKHGLPDTSIHVAVSTARL
jgi:hypothetical protein